MKYTDGKNIMVYAQSADGAPVGAALETVSKAASMSLTSIAMCGKRPP